MTDQATREAAADLLDRARDVLAERGWCQGYATMSDGRVCLESAMFEAAEGRRWAWATCSVALQAVRGEVGRHPYEFNDLPTTTQSDADLAMKRAAHSLREATS